MPEGVLRECQRGGLRKCQRGYCGNARGVLRECQKGPPYTYWETGPGFSLMAFRSFQFSVGVVRPAAVKRFAIFRFPDCDGTLAIRKSSVSSGRAPSKRKTSDGLVR